MPAIQPDRRRAKNVILFLGDGMGVATVTAARILAGQQKGMLGEEHELSFEKFPHLAHSKTYQVNQQVPDSAPTMTAIVTGSKTNDGFLSIAPSVIGPDFAAAARPENRLRTILEQAEETGDVDRRRVDGPPHARHARGLLCAHSGPRRRGRYRPRRESAERPPRPATRTSRGSSSNSACGRRR